ncbi:hypothetical protein Trydic_g20489 [Trypoxylus dichotomus]
MDRPLDKAMSACNIREWSPGIIVDSYCRRKSEVGDIDEVSECVIENEHDSESEFDTSEDVESDDEAAIVINYYSRNRENRCQRIEEDPAAGISPVFGGFVQNCLRQYFVGELTCIVEVFVGSRSSVNSECIHRISLTSTA